MKINNFPGELTDISAKKEALRTPATYSNTLPRPRECQVADQVCFPVYCTTSVSVSKSDKMFCGYFDPDFIYR